MDGFGGGLFEVRTTLHVGIYRVLFCLEGSTMVLLHAFKKSDPVEETRALSATRTRQLMGMPGGDSVIDSRDRALLKFSLHSGAPISTGCRLRVSDFHQDGDEHTIRLHEKGDHRRTIWLHYAAPQAIREYLEKAGIQKGSPLPCAARLTQRVSLRPSDGPGHHVPDDSGLPGEAA